MIFTPKIPTGSPLIPSPPQQWGNTYPTCSSHPPIRGGGENGDGDFLDLCPSQIFPQSIPQRKDAPNASVRDGELGKLKGGE